jgi:hypothetical protein
MIVLGTSESAEDRLQAVRFMTELACFGEIELARAALYQLSGDEDAYVRVVARHFLAAIPGSPL